MEELPTGVPECLTKPSELTFQDGCLVLARMYAPYLGLDFDKDIFPNLNNKHWWEADYGLEVRKGVEVGMSTHDAFKCLIDICRTQQISLGISETIGKLKSDGRSVTAIDAGAGTGILSILMLVHGADRVYAIEINEDTYRATSDFLSRLGLEDKIVLLKGDATEIDLEGVQADLLVSENLSTGLLDEPQYQIIGNLSRFMKPKGEVIPFQGQLSVSLGNADWEGVDPEINEITARRLKSCQIMTELTDYATVDSKPGMSIPVIRNRVPIPLEPYCRINTLFIHNSFRINRLGTPHLLHPDGAEFLGKSRAFRLKDYADTSEGAVTVDLNYEAGRRAKEIVVAAEGNNIVFHDPYIS